MYVSRYTNPYGNVAMLTGINEWGDYLGNIIMEVNESLEVSEKEERLRCRYIKMTVPKETEVRRYVPLRPPSRVNQT